MGQKNKENIILKTSCNFNLSNLVKKLKEEKNFKIDVSQMRNININLKRSKEHQKKHRNLKSSICILFIDIIFLQNHFISTSKSLNNLKKN